MTIKRLFQMRLNDTMINAKHYLLFLFLIVFAQSVLAQTPANVGRSLSPDEVDDLMYTVGPEGRQLPPGQGTAREGERIYTQSCIFCHGPEGLNGPQNTLKGSPRFPFATSIWDYIHRAMPRSVANVGVQERQLSNDETYALTAYILYINGIMQQDEELNARTILDIEIPIEEEEFD